MNTPYQLTYRLLLLLVILTIAVPFSISYAKSFKQSELNELLSDMRSSNQGKRHLAAAEVGHYELSHSDIKQFQNILKQEFLFSHSPMVRMTGTIALNSLLSSYPNLEGENLIAKVIREEHDQDTRILAINQLPQTSKLINKALLAALAKDQPQAVRTSSASKLVQMRKKLDSQTLQSAKRYQSDNDEKIRSILKNL